MNHADDPTTVIVQRNRPAVIRLAWLTIRLSLVAYFVFVAFLVFNETRLVYPASKYPRGNWQPDDFVFEEVSFESEDGVQIFGWFLPHPGATETVLICHGNGENVAEASAWQGPRFQQTLNANVFVFDYRGYGKSEGVPSEQAILDDTASAMKWLNNRTGTRPADVIVVGHSIGGGPAVHIAATMGAKALILQQTFSSLVDVAQDRYWFVPVGLLMRNRFPSSDKIRSCKTPLHQCHGDCDQIVPIESGRRLFDNSPAEHKTFYVNPGRGHWDQLPGNYWNSVRDFVATLNADQPTN